MEAIVQKPDIIYAGTYSVRGSKGIYVLQYNQQKLKIIQTVDCGDSPTFLTLSPDKKLLYAVYKTGSENGKGVVRSFLINDLTGHLTLLNERSSEGEEPAHISTDPLGRHIYVSNYGTGNLAIYPIENNGSLGPVSSIIRHSGSSVVADRQDGPHIHSAIPSSDGNFVYVSDLGIDRIMVYRVSTDGVLNPEPVYIKGMPAGSGPRHFTLHPHLDYAYSLQELSSTITAFKIDKANGDLYDMAGYTMLPQGFTGDNLAADVHISKDGKYLYSSNRGHDSIAIYSIDQQSGSLRLIGHEKTLGKEPRNFMIRPQDNKLLVGHQESDQVVVFQRDQLTGLLSPTGEEIHIPSAVCLVQW